MEKEMEQKGIAKESSSEWRNGLIWDCESSLYDSFELKAFVKQLNSAISSRTSSMPHLSDHRLNKKPRSKISRSFYSLMRAVFRPKSSNKTRNFGEGFGYDEGSKEGFYMVYQTPPDFDGVSPEVRSLVRRSASQRFTSHHHASFS